MTILYIFILHFSLYSTQRGYLTWKLRPTKFIIIMSRPIVCCNMDSHIMGFRISFFLLFHLFNRTKKQEVWRKFILYSFFWVIMLCLNFMCGRFGTVCPIFIGSVSRKSRKILLLKTLIHISLIQATMQRHSWVHIYALSVLSTMKPTVSTKIWLLRK
jgi:hypothetical protein